MVASTVSRASGFGLQLAAGGDGQIRACRQGDGVATAGLAAQLVDAGVLDLATNHHRGSIVVRHDGRGQTASPVDTVLPVN
jgi:L-serine deaminase